jgi:hypothetical protein
MYKEPQYSKKGVVSPLLNILQKEKHPGTKIDDKTKIKVMALELSENSVPDHFSNVILYADKITEKLGSWLRKHLVTKGNLIQVYSGLGHASRYYEANKAMLDKHTVSTESHFSYYEVYREDKNVSLFPFPGEDSEQVIELVKTRAGFSSSTDKPTFRSTQSICIEKDKSDAMDLHIFLVNLSSKNDAVEHLMAGPVLPYLSSICKWDKGAANCKRLDTVIVDKNDDVKTCWNGQPVGKVGMSYRKIAENLEHLRLEMEQKKGCQSCDKKATCTKCIFPAPLSGGEYCHLKKYTDTNQVAKLVHDLDMIKEV